MVLPFQCGVSNMEAVYFITLEFPSGGRGTAGGKTCDGLAQTPLATPRSIAYSDPNNTSLLFVRFYALTFQ